MRDKIVIIGCGRKAKEVKEFIEEYDLFEILGFSVDKQYINEPEFCGLPVYPFEKLDTIFDKNEIYTFAASSHFNYLNRVKRILYNKLKENGYKVANLISPKATVKTVDIGDGNWIKDYAFIDRDVKIGSNNVINIYSYIAHYSVIGNHNFFGLKTLIGGGVKVKDQCFFGLNATVFNSVYIGNKCIIGAGTVIKKHIKDYCMVRLTNDNVEVFEYDAERIENKLAPMQGFERKTYEAIKRVD